MPSVTLNQKVVEKIIAAKMPLNKLKERISMLGTDLDSIENGEIKVEIFPNRPDMLCEHGFSRALASFIGSDKKSIGLRKYTVSKSGYKVMVDSSVTMRPYTACAIVRNLQITEEQLLEIIQLQDKLATTHGRNRKKSAYGIYPLGSLEFPIKYIALDPSTVEFQPLGFEHRIKASDILELHPKGRAYANLTKDWKKYPFFIDARGEIMCMLPFTNSEDTGKVVVGTRDVFLEATGTDLENVQIALNIMVCALADMGGKVESLDIVYKNRTITTPNLTPKKMKLDILYVNKILGLKLSTTQIKGLLAHMGFGFEKGTVLIPPYRADILHPIDFVEDIAIAYGYENFKPVIPSISTIGEQDPLEKFISKLRMLCIGLGVTEVVNYHLASHDDLMLVANEKENPIPLKNSISEHNHLRHSLIPGLLKTLGSNQHNEYPQCLFEVGRVFSLDSNFECGVNEKTSLGLVICHEKSDFTEMQQKVDALFRSLGLQLIIKEVSHTSFISGRVGALVADEKVVGIIGEIHPQTLTEAGLMMPCAVAQIDVELLFELSEGIQSPVSSIKKK